MCGDLWLSEDGARIFTACGNVFRATTTRATDMTYAGALEATTSVRHLADSAAAGEVLAVPGVSYFGTGHEDESILVFAADFLTRKPSVPVSPFITQAGTFAGHGRFVFWSADASHRYALVQADAGSAMLEGLRRAGVLSHAGVGRILLHLGLDSRGPPVARAQAPPDFSELGPSYDAADPHLRRSNLPRPRR